MIQKLIISVLFVFLVAGDARSQTRDEMVREDQRKVTEDGFWIYNDLDEAFRQAKETGMPILVVLRCIPCHECVKLDDDLVDKDPVIRPLLDQFVCVRQVSTNGLDLELFQYDTDQSFAVFMLSADRTIYGRFGTRSHRTEWLGDVSLPGLAKSLQGALDLHKGYPGNRELLVGKTGGKPEVATPEQYPLLKEKYTDTLNYKGDVAKSCIHCHQIGEAQRAYYWAANKPIPEKIVFPYPHPKSLGLIIDSKEMATVKSVTEDSIAQRTGLRAGDRIVSFAGQPPLSIADVQWVLHQTDPRGAEIPIVVDRDGQAVALKMKLEKGWRQVGDLSWRVTSWSYSRMVTGGFRAETLDDEARKKLDLDEHSMALLIKSVGKYGAHAAAMKAGVRKGDLLVSYDGRKDLTSETELFNYALKNRSPGDKIDLTIMRDGKEHKFQLPIQR
jgi:hypothetical protein